MTEIPFFIVITKPNNQKIQNKIICDVGDSLDIIKNKLTYIIQEEINNFKNIPLNYDEFIYKCWYKKLSADSEPFEYKIFENGQWISPWAIEDLYNEACEIVHKLELLNSIIKAENYPTEEIEEFEENE